MVTAIRTTDDKARISLPGNFANCTVLMEQVSDTEVRIRKARVIPEDEFPFVEESMTPLSDRDRDLFLALLDNPPPPNEALKRLMEEGRRQSDQPSEIPVTSQVSLPSLVSAAIRGLTVDDQIILVCLPGPNEAFQQSLAIRQSMAAYKGGRRRPEAIHSRLMRLKDKGLVETREKNGWGYRLTPLGVTAASQIRTAGGPSPAIQGR